MICWSNSPGANCPRVWSINTDAWGNDNVLLGAGVFQPVVFDGQYRDNETVAWQNDGQTIHRPALVLNGSRTYDSWIGAYAQTDPLIASTWSTYVYVDSNPVGAKDPSGKGIDVLDPTEDHCPDGGGGTPPPPPPPCPGEAKLGVASSCPNPPFVDLWKWVRHPFGGEDDDQGVAVLSEDPGTPLVTFPTAVFGQWRCSLDCVLKVPWSPGVELKQPFDHVGPYDQACHLVNSQCKIWLEAIAAASGGKIANYVPKDCPEICKPVGPVDGRL